MIVVVAEELVFEIMLVVTVAVFVVVGVLVAATEMATLRLWC